MAAIKNSFQRSVQWSPAIHREQPVGRLRGGCARRACGVSCTWFVDGASWRGMASTRVMVPKDCNRSGRWRAAHLPAHQRCRWMDSVSHDEGKPPAREARTRPQCRCDMTAARSSMPAVRPAQERLGSSLTVRRYRFPEVGRWKVNVLSRKPSQPLDSGEPPVKIIRLQ